MSADDRNLTLRTLDVLEALCGFAARGASNADLAAAVKTSPPNVTRAMAQLIEKGWARKDETTGHFHPTPRMGRVFGRVLADLDRAEQALATIRHNFTRTH